MTSSTSSTQDNVAVQEDQICDRCKTLDFETFFRIPAKELPPCGRYLADLGALYYLQKSYTCPVCALFISVLQRTVSQETEGSSQVYHFRICPSSAAFREWSRYTSESGGESVILAIVSGDSDAKITRDKICSSLFWGCIATTTTPCDVVIEL